MPRLKIICPKVALETELEAGHALTIGRHISNSLPIPDTEISRRHAQIFPREGQTMVSDLGSRNGVYVNGEKVKEKALEPGDEIALGMSLLFFDPPANTDPGDLVSKRGAALWKKLPSFDRFEPFTVSTLSRVELDEMVSNCLERSGSTPQIPASIISRSLGFALSLDEPATAAKMCEVTAHFLLERVGAERLVIMRTDSKKKELQPQYLHDAAQMGELEVGKDILRIVVDAQQSIYSADCSEDFRFARVFKQSKEAVGSFLAVPVFVREAYHGFIYMDQPPGTRQYDFRSLVQAYLAGMLLGKCIYWYGMGRMDRKAGAGA